jgi:hypothetical protein
MEKKSIYCPVCKSKLGVTHRGRYEDLSEHVSDPNGTPSMKDGYQCLNVDWCEASHLNFTWIQDGDCYPKPPEGVSWSEANKRLKEASVSGMEYALNSWNHYYNLGKKKIEDRKKSFRIGKYRIDIKPKEKGYKYPEHKQYMPSTFRWEYQIWKKSENMSGYTSIVPTHRMVLHCIRSFKSSYKSAIYNPEKNKNSIKECMDRINCTQWGTKDDRTYAKISSFLIKIMYPRKCETIRSLALKHTK